MLRHSNSPTSEEKLMAYIYDDVDDSDIFTFKPLQDNSDSGDDKVVSSEQHLELINENKELKVKIKILEEKANLLELRLSEIYKTAKAEIERKDCRIKELNQARDDILFRRNRSANRYYKGANDDHHYNRTYQSPAEKFKLHDKDKQVKEENIKKDNRSAREMEEKRGLTTKTISTISTALTSKQSEDLTKTEVASETQAKIVDQQTSEGSSNHPSIIASRKREKSKSPDIITIEDSDQGDSENPEPNDIEKLTTCRVIVSNSEQKLVNNHKDAQKECQGQEKKPAARVTRSKSDYQPLHIKTTSSGQPLKRDTKNDQQTLDCKPTARTRSEHQQRVGRTFSRSPPRSSKLPRTPPGSPPRSHAALKRPISNSPSRRKTRLSSPPRRAISPQRRNKSSCRTYHNSPSRRVRSRSPPRSFRDRGRPRSSDRKRWTAEDNRRRSRSRGNDTREHQQRREKERAVKERALKVDRHGNATETYRDWKKKQLQEKNTKKVKEEEMKISADQELADLFREGGGTETPLFGSETGSNFDEIHSDNETERTSSINNKENGDEATECKTSLNISDLSDEELERVLQKKLKELNSSSLQSEFETSNVNQTDNFVQVSQKHELGKRSSDLSDECRKSLPKERTLSDNDLRIKLSKKSEKNMVEETKNGEIDVEERLYGVNNGATKIQSLYGSIIETVQKIRVRESVLLKNSVTEKTSQPDLVVQVEESNLVEKSKKKICIDDYKKRNEVKNSADDQSSKHQTEQQTLTDQLPVDVDKVKESLPVATVTEKIENTLTLPDQHIKIIEDRVISCAKTEVKQTTVDLVKPDKKDVEIDIEAESNSLPSSGQEKGSFLNDFDFSLSSEDELDEKIEKKSVAQSSVGENELKGQVEQNTTKESRSEDVNQKVEKESLEMQSSSTPIATNNLPNENLNTPTKVKETTEQKSKESETECIENIQEAIHQSTMNSELATITKTAQLNTEELQKCLEDNDDSVAKSSDVKPKTVREQIILLFGSDSPATPEIKKVTKSRKIEAQKACRNLTNLGDSTKIINSKANVQKSKPKKKTEIESFRVRDKAVETNKTPKATQLEENQQSETSPVFCNNPNYIPVSPNSRKTLADYIEKQKQPDQEETKEEEKFLDETTTNEEKKSSKTYKRKPFKVKMPFPNQEGKKQSKDSEPNKRKRPAKNPKTKITELKDDSFTSTIKKIVEAEKKKCTKPKVKRGKSSKKPEQTDPTVPLPCDEVNTQLECDDSLKEKSLKRITPIKVGEVTGDILITSNKRKLITEEQRPEKIQKIDTDAQTSNQSPLPHMEEMLKHLERKATPPTDSTLIVKQKSYVYTNIQTGTFNNTKLPRVPSGVAESNPLESFNDNTVNQIHLDSKDVSMLGTNERVIFDKLHEYLGDKSLATFDTVDKCSSHFDFSNMLHKSVTTSTPVKKGNCTKTDDGLTTSKVTKTYLTSPLKRDKRRRIAIKVVDLPKT